VVVALDGFEVKSGAKNPPGRVKVAMGGNMLKKLPISVTLSVLIAVITLGVSGGTAQAASNRRIFNSIPDKLPGNMASVSFQATQASEFGDEIRFAAGGRELKKVKVVMSSWACEQGTWNGNDCETTPGDTFSEPITFNIYGESSGGTPGELIASLTKTFDIKYRPSVDPGKCSDGKWYSKPDQKCYSGHAQRIGFNFADQNVTLPDQIVYGVVFNTSGFGPDPYGYDTACNSTPEGCPYDSLNVGAAAGLPQVGQDVYLSGVFYNSATGGNYCDHGTGGTGSFRLDDGCWTGNNPLVRFRVKKSS
jgi:hypothetical protein